MPSSVKINDIGRSGNRLYIRFEDGEEIEGTRRELRQHVRDLLSDDDAKRILKLIAIARGLRASADGDDADDLDVLIGKTLTFNRNAPLNILRIT